MDSVIIIGGGAAGLMCARELSKHKIPVTVLEAKDRLGGRIHTITDGAFSQAVETGAEFIHGDLPLTLSLLDEAGIKYHRINDKMFHLKKGKLKRETGLIKDWDKLMQKMGLLKNDMPLNDFLNSFFSDDKYEELHSSIKSFANGFDLADATTASTQALYREWNNEMKNQYRIDGGYKKLVSYLETECKNNGCSFVTACCAKKINWQKNKVNVLTMCSNIYKASKVIIATPVSVLRATSNSENYLEFEPAIPEHTEAAKNIGFGSAIKIILEFNENFWLEKQQEAGFIFIDEPVPVWWTQLPVENNVLTGWLGSDKANSLKDNTDDEILQIALQSLANAFAKSVESIVSGLKAAKIANWCKEPDINGGYSFNTIKSIEAKTILGQSINDTIFFTGEALFEGMPGGTVEAALSSGKETALKILKLIQQ